MINFTALEAEITRDNDVNSSAATLIASLAKEIADNVENPEALELLVTRLREQSDALAAAVAANTPAEPPVEPPVV